jgi:cytochrome c oxidase subunit 4
MPYKILYGVFGALIFFTILTVLTAAVDLGGFNVPLALAIAGAKATLVVMFFMALKYDTRVNILVFSIGLIFVVIFLGFTMLDTEFRGTFDKTRGTTVRQEAVQVEEQQRRSDQIDRLLEAEAQPASGTDAMQGAAAGGE